MRGEIAELVSRTSSPVFWNDREGAGSTLARLTTLKKRMEPLEELRATSGELQEIYALALDEGDESMTDEILESLEALEARHGELALRRLLGGEDDAASAFVSIHAGAGGTEACDWASMLLRMYTRWSERRGYSVEIIDFHGAEGGIKSVTIQVNGESAFGYLKAETGVHRLVRISPFDASSRRHTTFASVFASPVIDDSINVDIRPEDLRIDTYRASGAGGQHVNKTDSAVRMTHIPTGIVVQCQNERSQFKNKSTAMKVLKSRLHEHYRQEQEQERKEKEEERKDISWGNQIRSYVFQPYTMVKDHRTDYETGNVNGVMDGDLDEFITAYLQAFRGRSRGSKTGDG